MMDCQKGKNAFRKQLSDLRDEMHEKVTALRREHERERTEKEKEMAQDVKAVKAYRNNEIASLEQQRMELSASNTALYT